MSDEKPAPAPAPAPASAVVDVVAEHRFLLEQDGQKAQLVYRLNGDRLILTHTEVPEELEGRGIGGMLVRAAADRAAADQLTVVPWCPYARRWLQTHADVADQLSIDWQTPAESL
jgi:predicted GNAT family acetyltransferase